MMKTTKNMILASLIVLLAISMMVHAGNIGDSGTNIYHQAYSIYPNSILVEACNNTYTQFTNSSGFVWKSTDATAMINNAFLNLTTDRTWKEEVVVKGNFENLGRIWIPSFSVLHLIGGIKAKDNLNAHFVENLHGESTGDTMIEIYGGEIDANQEGNTDDMNCVELRTVTNSSVHDCCIHAGYRLHQYNVGGGCGIELTENCLYNCIYNNLIQDFRKDGIQVDGSSYNVVYGNRFVKPIGFFSETSAIQCCLGAHANIVSDNTIDEENQAYTRGIKIHGSVNNIISNNRIYNAGVYGITIICQNYPATNNLIIGNQIYNCSGTGISLYGDADKGLTNEIENNVINYTGSPAISLSNQTSTVISGNTITGKNTASEIGIQVYECNRTLISNNKIIGIGTTSATNSSGIRVFSGCIGTDILNNDFTNISRYGIKTGAETYKYCNFTHIGGNFFYNVGDGITMNGDTNSSIDNNMIINCLWYAVALDDGCNDTSVMNNRFVNVTLRPVIYLGTVGTNIGIIHNEGFLTEASGSVGSCMNGTWVAHGLAGTPTNIVLTGYYDVFINGTCHYLQPTIIAKNSTHFQIGFYLRDHDQDLLRGAVAGQDTWTYTSNLDKICDGDLSTYAYCYKNATSGAKAGGLYLDMGSAHNGTLRVYIGGWTNTSSFYMTAYTSPNNSTWAKHACGTGSITSTTEQKEYFDCPLIDTDRYIEIYFSSGATQNLDARIYDCIVIAPEQVLPVATANARTIFWNAVYAP